ncbi:MAG TPA: hypothetical protein VMW52_04155, partial [Phycisphaerae bacterium]|nr:hypothetical protein [Phycisphaerae bacterium]
MVQMDDLFHTVTQGAVIRRAVSSEDLAAAYRLVHDVFVERGYILPHPSGMRVRKGVEGSPVTATFIAMIDGRVVGAQSIVEDSGKIGLPADGAFRGEVDSIRGDGKKVCEAVNQAVAPDYRKTGVALELMRCMFAHALMIDC